MRTTRPKLSLPAKKSVAKKTAPARLSDAAGALKVSAGSSPRPATKLHPEEKVERKIVRENQPYFQSIYPMRETLAERFPKCFRKRKASEPKQPLKIGITHDIWKAAPELSRYEVGRAIYCYTSSSKYLKAVVKGATRIDLDGNAAGKVTAAEEWYSQWRLRERLGVRTDEVSS